MKCLYCKTEFKNKRNTAKFCSAKCRVYFNRKVKVTDRVTDSVTKSADWDLSEFGEKTIEI